VDRAAQKQAAQTEKLIKDPTVPVSLQPVRQETLTDTLEINGELTTSADVTVGARVAGKLIAVYVHDGDRVAAGKLIAEQDTSMARSQVQQAQGQVSAARAALAQAMTNAQIGPQRSAAGVATAEAQLRSAKAQLAKARAGARSEEIAQAKSQVNAAKSALETARKERDRARVLFEQGAVSQQRLDGAENAYQSALSNYEAALENLRMVQNWTRPEDLQSAEEQVRQAEESLRNAKAEQKLDTLLDQQVQAARANLRSAEAQLAMARQAVADAQIRSPFAGRVFGKPVQAGAYLNPGSPVARIVGENGVYFEGEAPESLVPSLRVGDPVKVTLDAVGGKSAAGRIVSVSPTSTEVARVYRVRIAIDGAPEGARAGMFARGEITLRSVEQASVIPQAAIVTAEGKSYVFTVAGGKAKRLPVKPGLRKDGLVQVDGLSVGQEIVVDGALDLSEGVQVRVQEAKKQARASGLEFGAGG